jgi:hypothetical protein
LCFQGLAEANDILMADVLSHVVYVACETLQFAGGALSLYKAPVANLPLHDLTHLVRLTVVYTEKRSYRAAALFKGNTQWSIA